MKKLLIVAALVALAVPCFAQANPAQTVPFDHWAYDAVQELVDQGVIIGYPDGTFKGDRAMTRYEFAAAISRLLDTIGTVQGADGKDGAAGAKGDAGPKGDTGPKGDAGVAGKDGKDAVVDEAAIAAIVNKLIDEFKDELADLRQDVDYLQDDVYDLGDRVTYIEEAMKGPKVFGWLDYRIGMVGDLDADNYYDNLTAVVGIEGQITDEVAGTLALKVRDTDDPMGSVSPFGATGAISAPYVDGNSAEQVWLDEAYITFTRNGLPRGTHTVGRQFVSYGCGLLVDNQRESQQGWRMQTNDVFGTNLDFDIFAGGADYTYAHSAPTTTTLGGATDGYVATRLSYDSSRGVFGINYLANGVEQEEGYSVDYVGSIFGHAVFAEYAMLNQLRTGADDPNMWNGDDNPTATIAGVELLKGSSWALNGFYSEAEAEYNPYYSLTNPYFESFAGFAGGAGTAASPAAIPWERWLRNPFVMPNVKAFGGELNVELGATPLSLVYYDLEGKSNFWNDNAEIFGSSAGYTMEPAYDQMYAISTTQNLADGVDLNLTYARQLARESSVEDLELLQAGIQIGF